ncbi:MAG: hypothetical protein JO170_25700 [Verrucomicrobia bacterium]|nr:hypothetical protein [Verrucomicrobiota bacterium]
MSDLLAPFLRNEPAPTGDQPRLDRSHKKIELIALIETERHLAAINEHLLRVLAWLLAVMIHCHLLSGVDSLATLSAAFLGREGVRLRD